MSEGGLLGPTADLLSGYRPNRHLRRHPTAVTAEIPMARPVSAVGSYARVSSDRQQTTSSIERQNELIDAYVAGQGATVVARHHDVARTGVTMYGRTGLKRLLAGVELGLFDTVVVEKIDRLSRSQEDLHRILKLFQRHRIRLHEAVGGEVEVAGLVYKGFLAAEEREQALGRCRSGRRRTVYDGRVPHRPCFGYQRDRRRPGLHVPHPVHAAVVKSMFERCDAGETFAQIAATQDVPTPGDCGRIAAGKKPKGRVWTARMVIDVVRNPIYAGILIDGRRAVVRDVATNEQVGWRAVPQELWDVVFVAHIALVDRALWDRAQGRVGFGRFGPRRFDGQLRWMLTGLVRCGHCGRRAENEHRNGRFRCHADDCIGVGETGIAAVERSVLQQLLDALDARPRRDFQSTSANAASFIEELRSIEAALQVEMEGAVAPESAGQMLAARRAQLERRADAIRVHLEPQREGAGPIDIPSFRAALVEALSQAGDRPFGMVWSALFDDVRRSVSGIAMRRDGSADRMVLELDAEMLGIAASDSLEPRVVSVAFDAAASAPAQVAGNSVAAGLADAAASPAGRLETEVGRGLERIDDGLNRPLDALGWSLPRLIEATAFLQRHAFRDAGLVSVFGEARTYDAAVGIIRRSGERGSIARALQGAGEPFRGGTARLFGRRGSAAWMAGNVEMALSSDAIERLAHRGSCGGLVDWLERSRLLGAGSPSPSDHLRLTEQLAALRMHGVDGVLAGAVCKGDDLANELIESVKMSRQAGSTRALLMVSILRGAGVKGAAAAHSSSAAEVRYAIRLYRACGPAALVDTGRGCRLTPTQLAEVARLALDGLDPCRPGEPINAKILAAICIERFAVSLTRPSVLSMLWGFGVGMRDRTNAPASKRRDACDVFRSMRFEGEETNMSVAAAVTAMER